MLRLLLPSGLIWGAGKEKSTGERGPSPLVIDAMEVALDAQDISVDEMKGVFLSSLRKSVSCDLSI